MFTTTMHTTNEALSGTEEAPVVPWRGINHLALITNDMDMTVRFWHGVLNARLVATVGQPTFRHYFFAFGESTTVAFFEFRGEQASELNKPAGVFDPRATQFDHLSLDLPDEAALLELRDRLQSFDCEVTDVVDHHMIRSIYFTDPNGIALEASWWVEDIHETHPGFGSGSLFNDPDPVAAVLELQVGTMTRTPVTVLADAASSSDQF